MADYSRR